MKPVEVRPTPISESRWEAIERNVFARIDARPLSLRPRVRAGRLGWMAVAAAVVFAAGAALGARPWSRVAEPAAQTVVGTRTTRITVSDSSLDVSPGAVVAVHRDEVSVESGTVDFGVPARGAVGPLVVTTPHTRVESEGATFRVDVVPTQTDVVVRSGSTRTITAGVIHPLNAGETWTSAAAVLPTPRATDSPNPTSVTSLPRPSAVKATSPQAAFELAESLERADPDRAVAQYDEVARGGGPWADNALFAEGRLQADRGRRDDARRLLTEYLARYPNGPNAADARALVERLSP